MCETKFILCLAGVKDTEVIGSEDVACDKAIRLCRDHNRVCYVYEVRHGRPRCIVRVTKNDPLLAELST